MTLNTFYHLARADFLQRVRSGSFMMMIALTAYLSYAFVPPIDAGYSAVAFGDYRLLYNSAGIGLMFGFTISTFVSLFAFYLVKNSLQRDRTTHVGQIIATTPTSKVIYLLGKWGSNLLLLMAIMGVMTLMAPLMQWLRGESAVFSLIQIVIPIWLIGLPMMSIVAGLAVLFESVPFLRGGFGNVVYYFVWTFAFLGVALLSFESGRVLPDPYGVSLPISQVFGQIAEIDPDYGHSLGILWVGGQTILIPFEGIDWTASSVIGRVAWLIAGALIAITGVPFFDRFNPSNAKPNQPGRIGRRWQQLTARWQARNIAGLSPTSPARRLTPLAQRRASFRPWVVFTAELRLLLKGQPWYLFAAIFGLFIYHLVTPLADNAVGALYPLILPLLIWSALGGREKQQRTESIIFTTPYHIAQQFLMSWLAGVFVTLLLSAGYLVTLILAAEWFLVLGVLSAALFIPALAISLGAVSGTRRLFEIVFLCWWYLAINGNGDDFIAWLDFTNPDAAVFYLIATVGLLAIAAMSRVRDWGF